MSGRPVVLGVDVGGSRTRARLVADGRTVAEAEAASASLTAVGDDAAAAVLGGLLDELGRPAVDAAVAGAAGCDTPAGRARMLAILQRLLGGGAADVVHDTRLVLAAAGLDAGIVLIAGTGSIAWGATAAGAEARAGGWGHLLGDEGSGYWVAREAVRRVLAEHDRGEPPGPLARRLLPAAGADEPLALTAEFHRRREPAVWAALSHLALEADPGLADAAADRLAELTATVATRLALPGPVVLAGGLLLGEPALTAAVERRLAEALPGAAVVRSGEEPVAGAVRLAQQLAARAPTPDA